MTVIGRNKEAAMRRFASLGSIAGAAILLLASSSLVVQGGTDELNPDAAWYASRYGVSDVEAERRLGLQAVAGELDARLTALDVDWYGGLWLEHEPDFKVVVFTTSSVAGPIRAEARELGLEGLVDVRAVAFSYADLEAESEKLRGLALESASIVSIDVSTNRVWFQYDAVDKVWDCYLDSVGKFSKGSMGFTTGTWLVVQGEVNSTHTQIGKVAPSKLLISDMTYRNAAGQWPALDVNETRVENPYGGDEPNVGQWRNWTNAH